MLEEPRESHGLDRNDKDRLIVGTVKNAFGVTTADVWTEDSVPKWITEAPRGELAVAGGSPQRLKARRLAIFRLPDAVYGLGFQWSKYGPTEFQGLFVGARMKRQNQ